MRQIRPISFKIDSLDSLGQGVSREGGRITFIPKTLPGEEGEAIVHSERKGVSFARLEKLHHPSPERNDSPCPHFSACPSCHYLHTSYERELKAKEESFRQLFRKLPLQKLHVIPAPERLGYRNRVQLHYDTKKKLLGMLDARESRIVEVPNCLIAEAPVLEELKNLYEGQRWLRLAPKNVNQGHVEIYHREGKTELRWNESYASGGFTQVYGAMNQRLREVLKAWFGEHPKNVLDLFAGNGNLTADLPFRERLCVDIYSGPKGSEFYSCSLYEKTALKKILDELRSKRFSPETLILDPPRSGLSDLSDWLRSLNPDRVAYVSCDPHTLVRDLSRIEGYELGDAYLLDFFPSTFHFESLVFLERK